jgi:hypothetical protein
MTRLFLCGIAAVLLAGCGLGSVHPGNKARVKLGFGCVTLADAKHAAALLDAQEPAEHLNAALFLTDPPKCLKLFGDETLTVTAEDGDFRQVRKENGSELWVAWQYLDFLDFK